MQHFVGLAPGHSVPASHASAQYSHFVGPGAQTQAPSPWTHGHHYLAAEAAAPAPAKDPLPELYRDYGGSSVRQSPAGSFMDSGVLSVFAHDPFAQTSPADGQTSCLYSSPHSHAPMPPHHFLSPR